MFVIWFGLESYIDWETDEAKYYSFIMRKKKSSDDRGWEPVLSKVRSEKGKVREVS